MSDALEVWLPAASVHPATERGPARCKPKGNHKEIRRYGKFTRLVDPDDVHEAEKALVRALAARRGDFHVAKPVAVELRTRFMEPVPESFSAWRREAALRGVVRPTSRPDRGNLLKMIEDALEGAGYVEDDSQIVGGGVEKWYAATPGYLLELRALPEVTRAEWEARLKFAFPDGAVLHGGP